MQITVTAPPTGRPAAPVAARIPMQRVDDEQLMGLVAVDTGKPIPVQVDSRGRLCWLEDALEPGESRRYKLRAPGFLADVPRVVICERGQEAEIREGEQVIARYNGAVAAHRPFLSPVLSPAGHGVTVDVGEQAQAAAGECAHHHSCWNGWSDVNGVDHWTDADTAGRQCHRRFTLSSSGPVFGRVSALIDWLAPDGTPQLVEQRVFHVFAQMDGCRIVDITSRLVMAHGPVIFGDTADGGICAVRVVGALAPQGGGILRNANGDQGEEDCWGASAAWCDLTGQIDDRFVGITMIDCPSNVKYPTYWNVRNDGLMAANPFGVSSFMKEATGYGGRRFEKGEIVMFRYRLVVHDGSRSMEDIGRLCDCFSQALDIVVQ